MYSETSPLPPPPTDVITSVEFSKMSNFNIILDPIGYLQTIQSAKNAMDTLSALTQKQKVS